MAIIRRGLVEALSLTFILYMFGRYVWLFPFVPCFCCNVVFVCPLCANIYCCPCFFHWYPCVIWCFLSFFICPLICFFSLLSLFVFSLVPCVIWCFLSFFYMSPHLFFSLPSKVFLLIHLVCRGAGRPQKKKHMGQHLFLRLLVTRPVPAAISDQKNFQSLSRRPLCHAGV